MATTGDLRNNIVKLKRLLRQIHFPRDLDDTKIAAGDGPYLLSILHYALLEYSPFICQHLLDCGIELSSKDDFRFMESIARWMLLEFNQKLQLNTKLFLSPTGYAERKVIITYQVIEACRQKNDLAVQDRQPSKSPPHPIMTRIHQHSQPSSEHHSSFQSPSPPSTQLMESSSNSFSASASETRTGNHLESVLSHILTEISKIGDRMTLLESRVSFLEGTVSDLARNRGGHTLMNTSEPLS
eukprot:TRINITY_DN15554_c0_g1::TRINITY_DN15554_c0_g1_i1::g.28488::m.28488 TRINITY_DN15554_c0_g1::TRINITY_DN15554_c0_g1_i1::g.28488  ORF type:complete len:241 (+),score=3.15,sp/Q08DB0/CEP44_BOVIN/32.82/4e-18,CEP44/PF15007.1/1.3e-30,Ank/PF00023.25/0.084 TRINITY_DN15554_c0_g1_i1:102-824(+)